MSLHIDKHAIGGLALVLFYAMVLSSCISPRSTCSSASLECQPPTLPTLNTHAVQTPASAAATEATSATPATNAPHSTEHAAHASPSDVPQAMASAASGKQTVRVELYIMSQCPFCVGSVETLHRVSQTLEKRVAVQVDYVATETANGFQSLHGPSEILGDAVQLCVRHAHPNPAHYLAFIMCQDEDVHDIPSNWHRCVKKLGLNAKNVESCYPGPKSKALLRASIARANAAGIRATPTIRIDGTRHEGPRDYDSVLAAICKRYRSDIPKSCKPASQ